MPTVVPAAARVHPYTFFKAARALEKKGGTQEEWTALRDRLWKYAAKHSAAFYNHGLDASHTIMRIFGRKPVKLTSVSDASLECAAWRMAWWCLTSLIYHEDTERRAFYLRELNYYLMVANTFAQTLD